MKIVDAEIATLDKQIAAFEARADEFVAPALLELAEPLGAAYVRKLGELREIASLLFAAQNVAMVATPYGRTSWHTSWQRTKFPKPPLDSVKLVPADRFEIKVSEADVAYWRNARNSLLAGEKVAPRRVQ
jgi:hypothetical protein